MATQNDIQQFLEKVKKMEKGEKLDLSSDEDLSIGIMNLISMEEHSNLQNGVKADYPLYEYRIWIMKSQNSIIVAFLLKINTI